MSKRPDELRPVTIQPGFMPYAEGSALVSCGNTKVICTASVEDSVPPFLIGKGQGWLTAEYAMLPRSTLTRKPRDGARGKQDGRSVEIQRLIGRALRPTIDLKALGERTVLVDCDVLQADGGTRTASITGAMVAVAQAVNTLIARGKLTKSPSASLPLQKGETQRGSPLRVFVAAVSVGVVKGVPTLDLCYEEDVSAEVDCNVVMTEAGKFVEIQGTAEHGTFDREQFDQLLDLASSGIRQLIAHQRQALGM